MGRKTYYLINTIRYWKRTVALLRRGSEWHLSEITADKLSERLNSNQFSVIIFDLRSTAEFHGREGHIPGSMSIPIRKLSSELKNPDSYIYDYKDKEIITLCPGGGLSLIGVEILEENGFTNVKSLHDGFDFWRKKGYPIIKTEKKEISPDQAIEREPTVDKKYSDEIHKTVDARGFNCPRPILMSKKALNTLDIGQVLEILTTDPGSLSDIPSWLHVTEQDLLSLEERGPKDFRFIVKRVK